MLKCGFPGKTRTHDMSAPSGNSADYGTTKTGYGTNPVACRGGSRYVLRGCKKLAEKAINQLKII